MIGTHLIGGVNSGKTLAMRLFENDSRFVSHLYPINYGMPYCDIVTGTLFDSDIRKLYNLTLKEAGILHKCQPPENPIDSCEYNFINYVLLKKFDCEVVFFRCDNNDILKSAIFLLPVKIKTIKILRNNLVSLCCDLMEMIVKSGYINKNDIINKITKYVYGEGMDLNGELEYVSTLDYDYYMEYESLYDNHKKIVSDLYDVFGMEKFEYNNDYLFYNKYLSSYDRNIIGTKFDEFKFIYDFSRKYLIDNNVYFDRKLTYNEIISK